MERILITGAAGQLGSELTSILVRLHGAESVIATDIQGSLATKFDFCHFQQLDVLDVPSLKKLARQEKITQVYHLAAILSAKSEKSPINSWKINTDSLLNILELAKEFKMDRVYWPSSIAVFGPHTPKNNTPQYCIMDPNSAYGISKQAGERWCEYYYKKHQVDVRSLRYPGLIGYKSMPGGGTTDYAVEIFHKAIAGEAYDCFLREDTYLPMMYMPDAIKATVDLMTAPAASVKVRSSYNLSGLSLSPKSLFQSIKNHYPDFTVNYLPDFRQEIADSWPNSIDDREARRDWGWQHTFDLDGMTNDILTNLPAYLIK